MTQERFRPQDWPQGCIGSAEAFFTAIREKAAMDPFLVDEAIHVLEAEFIKNATAIGSDPSEQRVQLLFYTGAYLGSKISWHRFMIYLKAKQFEAQQEGLIPKETT
jgi:hypothetical protein